MREYSALIIGLSLVCVLVIDVIATAELIEIGRWTPAVNALVILAFIGWSLVYAGKRRKDGIEGPS